MRKAYAHVIRCTSHNQQIKKKSHLKEEEITHILISAKNMELYLFLLTALFKLSARNLCTQEIVSSIEDMVMEKLTTLTPC